MGSISFIDKNREDHGVEPICQQLAMAPSTYYTNLIKSPEFKLTSVEFPEKCHVSRRLKGVGSVNC
jgi:hypothetical protein